MIKGKERERDCKHNYRILHVDYMWDTKFGVKSHRALTPSGIER